MQKLILRNSLGKCAQVHVQDVPTAALSLFNRILQGYSFDTESCPYYFMGLSDLTRHVNTGFMGGRRVKEGKKGSGESRKTEWLTAPSIPDTQFKSQLHHPVVVKPKGNYWNSSCL